MYNLSDYRNSKGYIIIDELKDTELKLYDILGRKTKYKFNYNNKNYIFKEINQASFEDLSHVLYQELIEFWGLKSAEYDFAIYGGKRGVLTPNFLAQNEKLITGQSILNIINTTNRENSINEILTNNIADLTKAIKILNSEHNTKDIIGSILQELVTDGVLLETDRNTTNWGYIVDYKKSKPSPFYDGSNIFGLNKSIVDIETKVKNIRDVSTMISYMNSLKRSLHFSKNTENLTFFEELNLIYDKSPAIIEELANKIIETDMESIFENLEKRTNFKIPYCADLLIRKLFDESKNILCETTQYSKCKEKY
ncbi:MAG: hypothetical protein ACK5HP_01410 [Bacilli bacterium]